MSTIFFKKMTNMLVLMLISICFVASAMEEGTGRNIHLLSFPKELIQYLALPKTNQYKDIVANLSVAKKLMQVNKYLYGLLAGKVEKCKNILDESNKYNENFETPLLLAVKNNDISGVMRLINNGANLDKPDLAGWDTPLYSAVNKNNLDIARILLENGADVQAQRHTNAWTPLFYAIKENLLDIARLLLEYGADVNKSNHYFNRTPLHTAVSFNNLGAIDLLLTHNADKNLTDNDRKSARDLTDDPQIVALLEKHETKQIIESFKNL